MRKDVIVKDLWNEEICADAAAPVTNPCVIVPPVTIPDEYLVVAIKIAVIPSPGITALVCPASQDAYR